MSRAQRSTIQGGGVPTGDKVVERDITLDVELSDDQDTPDCVDEEPESLTTLLLSLRRVAEGGSLEYSREVLRRIMPKDRANCMVMVDQLRRACQAMEQLRNAAMEISAQNFG